MELMLDSECFGLAQTFVIFWESYYVELLFLLLLFFATCLNRVNT
jgi:hypothetical protein